MAEKQTSAPPPKAAQLARTAVGKIKETGNLKGLKRQEITDVLSLYSGQMAQALPKHLTPERMIQFVVQLAEQNPRLAECDFKSFLGAVMEASILGFEPVKSLGLCFFVPYHSKEDGLRVQFQMGYAGVIELAYRSERVEAIQARVVYEGDHFHYQMGTSPKIDHWRTAKTNESVITHAYVIVHLKGGGTIDEVLSFAQIEKRRKLSQAQRVSGRASEQPIGIWKDHYPQMAMKTVVHAIKHYLPISILQRALASDEKVIDIDHFLPDGSGTPLLAAEPEEIEAEVIEEKPEAAPEPVKQSIPDPTDRDGEPLFK